MNEELDRLNIKLKDYFGSVSTGEPNWRVVYSNDQFEDRYGDYEDRTPEGLLIRRVSEWRHVPKYSQWIVDKWVLEALVEVPLGTLEIDTKLTYEPMYGFPHIDKKPRIPIWAACKLLIDGVNEKVGITVGARYKDPESNPREAVHYKQEELKRIEEDLYGNETDIGDALAYREGVGFTTSKIKSGEKVIENG